MLGEFYEGDEGTAIYNASFRPIHVAGAVPVDEAGAVISDWKFFLDDDEWLDRWAGRYEVSGARALAEELRPFAVARPERLRSGGTRPRRAGQSGAPKPGTCIRRQPMWGVPPGLRLGLEYVVADREPREDASGTASPAQTIIEIWNPSARASGS